MDIMFDPTRHTSYLGRNGVGTCSGVRVSHYNNFNIPFVELQPINSKGDGARCQIVIPEHEAKAVAAAIGIDLAGIILDHLDKKILPSLLGINNILDEEIERRLKGE